MPSSKGKRRAKIAAQSAMEDETNSVCSSSTVGDVGSLSDTEFGEHDEQGTVTIGDTEARIGDALDALTSKSAKSRETALSSLARLLSDHVVSEFVLGRRDTFSFHLERCIKRGSPHEQIAAMDVLRVIFCQLGCSDDTQVLVTQLAPLLSTLFHDPTKSPLVRGKCAEVLSLGSFVMDELADRIHVQSSLERELGLGDARIQAVHVQEPLTSNLLVSWGLLNTLLPASHVLAKSDRLLLSLRSLLDCDDLNVRMVAGDLIALIYEQVRSVDEDFVGPEYDGLCAVLKQLATDCSRHRSKRDRKVQRSSFRDVLAAVEDGSVPEETLKLSGGRDSFCLYSFARIRQYSVFKDILGSGVKAHLQENEFLREVFDLGKVLLPADDSQSQRMSHQEKHYYNAAASKVRTQARSKQRDKRVFAV